MYLGRIVELASCDALFAKPVHPYAEVLIAVAPAPDPTRIHSEAPLEGEVPSAINPPRGCAFHPRFSLAVQRCRILNCTHFIASALVHTHDRSHLFNRARLRFCSRITPCDKRMTTRRVNRRATSHARKASRIRIQRQRSVSSTSLSRGPRPRCQHLITRIVSQSSCRNHQLRRIRQIARCEYCVVEPAPLSVHGIRDY